MRFDELNPTASLKQQAYFLSQATVIGQACDSASGTVLKLFWGKPSLFPTGSELQNVGYLGSNQERPAWRWSQCLDKQGNWVLLT